MGASPYLHPTQISPWFSPTHRRSAVGRPTSGAGFAPKESNVMSGGTLSPATLCSQDLNMHKHTPLQLCTHSLALKCARTRKGPHKLWQTHFETADKRPDTHLDMCINSLAAALTWKTRLLICSWPVEHTDIWKVHDDKTRGSPWHKQQNRTHVH